ncbi:hypothetical protein [Pseudonocardia sp. KRD291]|uniref:hypothetical protein n=1 Tax=Pseudonocardia sp. KRD291 TaxID=2792007 RepID=UPI001C49DAE1|nr:hypothetical protein [Pseudonocardia sp. KRD291]MBW0103076.1 hypothetical protein [Pseudonocardia sp. KRD291]
MPIRSSRGRAGAYRSIWQWPLRSPVNLVVSLVVLVLLASGAVYLGGKLGGSAQSGGLLAGDAPPSVSAEPSSGSSAAPSTTPTPTALPPVAPLTPRALPLSAAPPEALAAARNWTAAWVNHPPGTTNARWTAGMRPFTTEEYLGVLAAVDPTNVPATAVTGAPKPTRVSPRSVQVEVPTNALKLSVLVVDTDAGWRVSRYDRA